MRLIDGAQPLSSPDEGSRAAFKSGWKLSRPLPLRGGRATTTHELNVLTLTIFVASLLYTSIGYFVENHTVEVPLLRLLRDPSLYPGDPFALALTHYPVVILWRAVAALSHLVPLSWLLVTLLVCERFLAIYAARRLARALVPGSMLAQVGAMILFAFAIRPLLGGGTIVASYFEHSGLAIAFLLLAMVSLLELRPVAWAIWTAIAFNTSSLYGGYALVYFAFAFLMDGTYRGQWQRWMKSFALFLLLSSYAIFLGVRATGHPLRDRDLWLAATRTRSWWHLYPLEWKWTLYTTAGELLGLLVVVLLYAGPSFRRVRVHAFAWSVAGAFWLGLAFVAAYVLESPRLLLLQLARGTDLWVSLSAVAMVAIAAKKLETVQGDAWLQRQGMNKSPRTES